MHKLRLSNIDAVTNVVKDVHQSDESPMARAVVSGLLEDMKILRSQVEWLHLNHVEGELDEWTQRFLNHLRTVREELRKVVRHGGQIGQLHDQLSSLLRSFPDPD